MASTFQTVYLVRHGEKDENLSLEKTMIFSPPPAFRERNRWCGRRIPPYATVKPLADSLQTVLFNTDVGRDDIDAIVIKKYTKEHPGEGNVLVCWEHKQLNDIATAIIKSESIGLAGAEVAEYTRNRFDIIWTIVAPYDKINAVTSEHCTPHEDAFKNDP